MLRLKNFGWIMGVAALTIYAMVVGRAILLPLVVAIVFWYLINVLANSFHRSIFIPLPRWLCLPAAVVTFLALTWLLADMIGGNLASIVDTFPQYQERMNALVAAWAADLGIGEAQSLSDLLGQVDVQSLAKTTAGALAQLTSNAALVLVYVIFLLLEQGGFDRKLSALFMHKEREIEVRQILKKVADDLQTYLRIKVLLALLIATYGWIVLEVVGVDFAAFWAALFFLFYFIPTIGAPISLVGPALFSLMQFDSIAPFLVVVLGIGLVYIGVSNFVEPAMMGRSLNLSPFVIILALVVFGTLWGLVGMVLCVPILVAIMILLAHFERTRGLAILLSANGAIAGPLPVHRDSAL